MDVTSRLDKTDKIIFHRGTGMRASVYGVGGMALGLTAAYWEGPRQDRHTACTVW